MKTLIVLCCSASMNLLGCASTPPRFKDQPVVWKVEDRKDIPEPEVREYEAYSYFGRVLVTQAWKRGVGLPDPEPARGTNALDEVPDSTWFTNRIGARDVAPAVGAKGPATRGAPQLPLTVVAGKTGGGNPGFIVEDATERKFLIKFDTKENPQMQTATSVIVNRMFWTLGYNVPEDTLVHFSKSDLLLAKDATTENDLGKVRPFTAEDVRDVLSQGPPSVGGEYRGSASLFLEGVPKGGVKPKGVRKDDPNDTIAHEYRRELRGLRVFAAWLGHTDMKEDNTIDMYVEDGDRHYLVHYLLDFGEALGAHQAEKGRYEDGYEHVVDYEENVKSLVSFGLWKRPWENQEQTPWPAIGAFDDNYFEPELWKEAYPYLPFREANAADLYWGAKLVMRFDRELVRAIVAEGQIENPDAEAHLVDALMGRRWKIGRAWLEALTPFDYLRAEGGRLCGVDLGVYYGLASRRFLESIDEEGRVIERWKVGPMGKICFDLPRGKDYGVLRLRSRSKDEIKPPMQVHYQGGHSGSILGIVRHQ